MNKYTIQEVRVPGVLLLPGVSLFSLFLFLRKRRVPPPSTSCFVRLWVSLYTIQDTSSRDFRLPPRTSSLNDSVRYRLPVQTFRSRIIVYPRPLVLDLLFFTGLLFLSRCRFGTVWVKGFTTVVASALPIQTLRLITTFVSRLVQ